MLPSGAWRGFWEQAGWGRQWMQPLTLRFSDGQVDGGGRDVVGVFTFEGTWTADGQVQLLKRYPGRSHIVQYAGRVDGEGAVVGRWTIPPFWTGPFALMPVIEDVAELPILAIGE